MPLHYIEHRPHDSTSLSYDLARHMYSRLLHGKIAVVTDNPAPIMAATRKQWGKLGRQIQHERAATLDTELIHELTYTLGRMQSMSFSSRPPPEAMEASVSFSTVEQFLQFPPVAHTIYITGTVKDNDLLKITAYMQKHGLIVMYGIASN